MTIERDQIIDPTRPITVHIKRLYADQEDDACRNRYITAVIYPTTAELREAATTYARKRRIDDDFANAGGCFQPTAFSQRYDRRKKQWVDTTKAFAGVLRLSQEYLTPEVIAHEAVHITMHVTRLHDWAKPDGEGHVRIDESGREEEAFAYLLGGVVCELTNIADRVRALTTEKERDRCRTAERGHK